MYRSYLGATPDSCPQIFAPVCGVNGKTYSNSCMAEVAGVAVASTGSCPAGGGSPDGGSSFPWFTVIGAGVVGFILGKTLGGR
jgi:hypothetical protein